MRQALAIPATENGQPVPLVVGTTVREDTTVEVRLALVDPDDYSQRLPVAAFTLDMN